MGQASSRKQHPHTIFRASYAPTGRAACKRCRGTIKLGELRLTREIASDVIGNNDGTFKQHFHLRCGSDAAANMRCSTTDGPTPAPKLVVSGGLRSADAERAATTMDNARAAFERRCAAR